MWERKETNKFSKAKQPIRKKKKEKRHNFLGKDPEPERDKPRPIVGKKRTGDKMRSDTTPPARKPEISIANHKGERGRALYLRTGRQGTP